MEVPAVSKKLLAELEEMGFPLARATRALHHSGNSSLEAAISWIIDHENNPDIDQMPLVTVNIDIEGSESSFVSEEAQLKAQTLRGKARRRKEEDEKKSEWAREKERIRAGKERQEVKRIQEENERIRFIALRKAEKEEENRARDRIRQKLLQDKVERRGSLALPPESPAPLDSTTPMMQENKEILPVTSAGMSVESATKIDLLRDCLRSLRRNNKERDAKVKKAFQTLLIYVGNIARNPYEEKFRKIRFSNPAFQERVGGFQQGIEFLELCGFERNEGGKYLYLPSDKLDMAVLRSAGSELQSAITNPFYGLLSK